MEKWTSSNHAIAGAAASDLPQYTSPTTASDSLVALDTLAAEVNSHPIWDCDLLRYCRMGQLSLSDFAYVFAQYHCYSQDFTRYLAAVMASCQNDYYRSLLAQNIWEEGGMLQPEVRHAQIYRAFLREGLGVDVGAIKYEASSKRFAESYLNECTRRSCVGAAAFLALGTEGIVRRLYGLFYEGLRNVGLADEALRFFTIHMECDDEHAASLAELVCSYRELPNWENEVRDAARAALDLRLEFFDALFAGLQQRHLSGIVQRIQQRAPVVKADQAYVFRRKASGQPLYENSISRLNIEFSVERMAFGAEVLDPRMLRIPGRRCNERHKHAHESLLLVLEGAGRVWVGDRWYEVSAGDCAFVPRWVIHQTENLRDSEMVILAITDFGLTDQVLTGNRDYRMRDRSQAGVVEESDTSASAVFTSGDGALVS